MPTIQCHACMFSTPVRLLCRSHHARMPLIHPAGDKGAASLLHGQQTGCLAGLQQAPEALQRLGRLRTLLQRGLCQAHGMHG